MSDQNTRRVGQSKSQTEREQNWFSENRASWLFTDVSSFCDLFMVVPPYLRAKNIWKYLFEFFQSNTFLDKNFINYGEISRVLLEDSLGLTQISKKFSWNSFFPEIPSKNLHWIWDQTKQILGQTNKYSSTKKIKQFHTQTNLPFKPGTDE